MLKSIDEQGKLTPELRAPIDGADSKVELEDLYAPYKPKRRTKAQIAREAGLEPLTDALLANPSLDPEAEAAKFIDAEKGVADAKAALDGARSHPDRAHRRERRNWSASCASGCGTTGSITSKVVKGKEAEGAKFSDYFDFSQKHEGHALAPRAGAAARPQRRHARSRSRRAHTEEGRPHPAERQDHGGVRHRRSRPSGRQWLAEPCACAWKAQAARVARRRSA